MMLKISLAIAMLSIFLVPQSLDAQIYDVPTIDPTQYAPITADNADQLEIIARFNTLTVTEFPEEFTFIHGLSNDASGRYVLFWMSGIELNSTLWLWDTQIGTLEAIDIASLFGEPLDENAPIQPVSAAISPDGTRFAAAYFAKTQSGEGSWRATIWQTETKEALFSVDDSALDNTIAAWRRMKFSDDSSMFIAIAHSILLWDATTGELITEVSDSTRRNRFGDAEVIGTQLYGGIEDIVSIWDTTTGEQIGQYNLSQISNLFGLDVIDDQTIAATVDADNDTLHIWDFTIAGSDNQSTLDPVETIEINAIDVYLYPENNIIIVERNNSFTIFDFTSREILGDYLQGEMISFQFSTNEDVSLIFAANYEEILALGVPN